MNIEKAAARLTQLATNLRLAEDAFDEDVYVLAGEASLDELNASESEGAQESTIATSERSASDVNNGGFDAQFRYLLAGYTSIEDGERELEAEIRKRAG